MDSTISDNKIIFNLSEWISWEVYCTEDELMDDMKLFLKNRKRKEEPQVMVYPWTWLYIGWIKWVSREWYWIMKRYRPKNYYWERCLYEWCRENDRPNWYWKRTAYDWVTITWEFVGWEPNWYCIFEDPLWCIMEWDFVNWNLTWKGKQYYWNGKLWYVWDFVEWQHEGRGKLYLEDWSIYEWEFRNSKYHWKGRYQYPDWTLLEWDRENWTYINN